MKKTVSFWLILMFSISAIEAANKSHLGQKIDNHIMLISDSVESGEGPCGGLPFEDKAFFQVFPNGTKSESPFQLASGKLVITDVEWSVFNTVLGDPLVPSRTLRLLILLGDGGPIVFQSELTVDADSAEGRPGKSEYATTGFVVGPGVTICAFADELSQGILAVNIERIVLRGYVIVD